MSREHSEGSVERRAETMISRVSDFDDAYANAPHIPGGEGFPPTWAAAAAAFRAQAVQDGWAELDISYGDKPRNRFDLFLPPTAPRGLAVFVHGGFWQKFDQSFWSHLARGPLAHGFAVAVPSYTLCPDADVGEIACEAARAIVCAMQRVPGPVVLAGHSVGGQIVARVIASGSPLKRDCMARVRRVVSISGVHDLRPIRRTAMNDVLRITDDMAVRESPVLLAPVHDADVVCWVGAAERPEFLRQSRILADVWGGLGAATEFVEEAGRHHFDIVDGLADPDHPLTRTLVAASDVLP